MIPVTTPTYIIKLKNADGYLQNTETLKVYIRQQDVLLVKEMEELVIDTASNSIGVTLSQKDTAKFMYKKGNLEFQVHGLLKDGFTAWKTYIVQSPVDKTLSKEIIKP